MNNTGKSLKKSQVAFACNAAKQAGSKANSAIKIIHDMAPVRAQAQVIHINNLHRAKLEAMHLNRVENIDMQATKSQKSTNIEILGFVRVEGIMDKIKEYAYNIRIYALAIKIALKWHDAFGNITVIQRKFPMKVPLEKNYDVVINNIVDIAKCIIDYSIIFFDKDDLVNRVHYIMKCIDSSIDKNYSIHIVECIENNPDVSIDNAAGVNIMYTLKSILQNANTAIDTIDRIYFDIDDVFFDRDNFTALSDKINNAFNEANKADKKFLNEWNRIVFPQVPISMIDLSQILSLTKKAKEAAQNAHLAYRNFGTYFDQFIPSIKKLFETCDLFFSSVDSNITSINVIHLGLEIDFKYLMNCHKNLQKAWKEFNNAIWSAYYAANVYNTLHDAYQNLENAITNVV